MGQARSRGHSGEGGTCVFVLAAVVTWGCWNCKNKIKQNGKLCMKNEREEADRIQGQCQCAREKQKGMEGRPEDLTNF